MLHKCNADIVTYNVDIASNNVCMAHMVICFDCPKESKASLDRLLAAGTFRDASEVISMALVNYEVIHRAMAEGRGLVNSGALMVEFAEAGSVPTSQRIPTETKAGAASATTADLQAFLLPSLFSLRDANLDELDLITADQPAGAGLGASPKDWLWGQYNRFLPLKATCRALLNLAREHPAGLRVDETAAKISYEACDLGDRLNASDRLYRRPREVAYGAAFPNTSVRGGESRSRFQTQFVAALKQGKLLGFPSDFRFVGVVDAKEPKLKLTKAGAEFAMLPNPVFDADRATNGGKWSEAETRFLLEHIKCAVPAEASAYIAIIEGIEAGENTPDKLDAYLRARFHLPGEGEIKATFLATQRTGAVARMVDLSMLDREKSGLRVTYTLTHVGKHFGNQYIKRRS